MNDFIAPIAQQIKKNPRHIANVLQLLAEGSTIPFIARYRKEMTDSMDEVEILSIKEENERLTELVKRKDAVISSIDEQGKLSDELKAKILTATTLTEVEDLYLPYKQKRKTKASVAREMGLEPLATALMKQFERDPENAALAYLSDEIPEVENALQGARDIIAEWISEDIRARNQLRRLFDQQAVVNTKVVKGKDAEGEKFKDYFDYNEPLKRCPSHRYLAISRGENEGVLRVKIAPEEEDAIEKLNSQFLKSGNASAEQVKIAIKDSYKRLLLPSIENEVRAAKKLEADKAAIEVFSGNLRQLLMAPPLGEKTILALDPGYRTGCKLVCLDQHGKLLHNETIYPHPPQSEIGKAKSKVDTLVNQYKIEAIAIGNGTAGRETENFIRGIRFSRDLQVFVVNEAGASVYSASKVARDEFPDYDITVRGAVSIGRRLMDPLAELVKIDPKSIGVGQYQHDVDQNQLKDSLDRVVESCVNAVGVDLNTASKHLLSYISGLGPQLAQNIIDYRTEIGGFTNRNQLKKVPRLGPKAFEQAAGFLRIRNGENSLDNTAVHPESYGIVQKMSKQLAVSVDELTKSKELQSKIKLEDYVSDKTGLPTLKDIMLELAKPGRDPRSTIKVFEFAEGIFKPEQLHIGMVLPGIVTNITNFGAFVDIGVKQDGLVHVSQLANRFVSDPNEVVHLNQHVKVKVLEVDIARKRIGLSMKDTD